VTSSTIAARFLAPFGMSSSDDDDGALAAMEQQALAPQEEPHQSPEERAQRKRGPLTAAKLEKANAQAEKRGLVYLSRVPPFMKPSKLRHLLSQHGEVLRIYLAAEGVANSASGDDWHSLSHSSRGNTPQMQQRVLGARKLAETAASGSQKGGLCLQLLSHCAFPDLACSSGGLSLQTRRLRSEWRRC